MVSEMSNANDYNQTAIRVEKSPGDAYTGILATPFDLEPLLLNRDEPPKGDLLMCATTLELTVGDEWAVEDLIASWQNHFDGQKKRFHHDTDRRWRALFDHYNINLNHPKAWERLAHSLACSHIPEFRGHEVEILGALVRMFNIDASRPDIGLVLAQRLAERFVPAFDLSLALKQHYRPSSKKPHRLSNDDAVKLLLYVSLKNKRSKEELSVNDDEVLTQLKQGLLAKIKLRTLNNLEQEARNIFIDYFSGEPTSFQNMLVSESLPKLMKEARKPGSLTHTVFSSCGLLNRNLTNLKPH